MCYTIPVMVKEAIIIMVFNRINFYRRIANMEDYSKLSVSELAVLCQKLLKKRKTLTPIESSELDILFSNLLLRYETMIGKVYMTRLAGRDSENYFDNVEREFMRAVTNFNPQKASFGTLAYYAINHSAFMVLRELATISYQYTDGVLTKKNITPKQETLSLDEIQEFGNLPMGGSAPEVSIVSLIKEKYKNKQDFLTWLILDWQEDVPEISNYVSVGKYSQRNLLRAYNKLIEYGNNFALGFTLSTRHLPQSTFFTRYKKCKNLLVADLREYMGIVC